jgi:hypothetical protein
MARKKVLRKNRQSGILAPDPARPSSLREQLGLYKDVLDAVLKTGAILLPIPALLIYQYLRLIGHEDLFAVSVLSLAGLSALLQVFLLLWAATVICVIAPSGIVFMFLGGTVQKRPSRGLPVFVFLSSVTWATFYVVTGYLGDGATKLTWRYWVPALLAVWMVLVAFAWISLSDVRTTPNSGPDTTSWSRLPRHWKAHLANFLRTISTHRLWRCLCVTAATFGAGLCAVYSVFVISAFVASSPLPKTGLKAWAVLFFTILFSFFPGEVYLLGRVANKSHGKAFTVAFVATVALIYVALLGGLSAEPVALAAMKGMAIVDNQDRTYEIVNADERPVYQALGYTPASGDRFVHAFIRFQFADVRLVCPMPYAAPGELSPSLDKRRGTSEAATASSALPEPGKRPRGSDGCIVPAKDEIKVVDLPEKFGLPIRPAAAALPHSPATQARKSRRRVRHPRD